MEGCAAPRLPAGCPCCCRLCAARQGPRGSPSESASLSRHALDKARALSRAGPSSCPWLASCAGRAAALVLQGQLLPRLACLPSLASLELHVDKVSRPPSCPVLSPACPRSPASPAAMLLAWAAHQLTTHFSANPPPAGPVLQVAGSLAELSEALPGLTHLSLRCRMESAALAPGLLEGLSQAGAGARRRVSASRGACRATAAACPPPCPPLPNCLRLACANPNPPNPLPHSHPPTHLHIMQLRRLELENVRVAQFTPRLAQALCHLSYLACTGEAAAAPSTTGACCLRTAVEPILLPRSTPTAPADSLLAAAQVAAALPPLGLVPLPLLHADVLAGNATSAAPCRPTHRCLNSSALSFGACRRAGRAAAAARGGAAVAGPSPPGLPAAPAAGPAGRGGNARKRAGLPGPAQPHPGCLRGRGVARGAAPAE